MERSKIFKYLRIAIGVSVITFLIFKFNPSEVGQHLKNLKWFPLVLAALADLIMIVLNSYRWKVLLRAKGIKCLLGLLFRFYLVGIFFSSFLPTSVGGDFVRILGVGSKTGRRADVFASVLVERLLGFFVLLPICFFAIVFVPGRFGDTRLIGTVALAGLVVFVLAYVILLRGVARRLSHRLDPVFRLLSRFELKERLRKAYESTVIYRDCKGAVSAAFGLSALSRLIWIGGCFFIADAFGLDLPFTSLMVVVPVVELLRMIPISMSGIGLREGAFVAMLGQLGVEKSMGLAYGIIVYAVFHLYAVLGGIIYLIKGFGVERDWARLGDET